MYVKIKYSNKYKKILNKFYMLVKSVSLIFKE